MRLVPSLFGEGGLEGGTKGGTLHTPLKGSEGGGPLGGREGGRRVEGFNVREIGPIPHCFEHDIVMSSVETILTWIDTLAQVLKRLLSDCML